MTATAAAATTTTTTEATSLLAGSRAAADPRRTSIRGGGVRGRAPPRIEEGTSGSTNDDVGEDEQDRSRCRNAWLLRFFSFVSLAATLASALLLVAQVASIAIFNSATMLGPIQIVLRLYVIIFCLLFLLSELQVEFVLRRAESYRNWFHRGFMYTWVGVLGMEESVSALGQAYPDHPAFWDVVVSILLRASSLSMIGVGTVYMLMGALCLRPVAENLRQQQLQQPAPP